MRIVAIQTSPNEGGLTATMAKAALNGAKQEGAEVELIVAKSLHLEACRQCQDGWGPCRSKGLCIIEDDLEQIREALYRADGFVLATPVYFGEVSEVTKNFMDRLRRTEAGRGFDTELTGAWTIGVAAAGGSGGGIVSCQQVLERYFQHLRCQIFDMIPVTRFSRDYKVEAAHAAGAALARHIAEET